MNPFKDNEVIAVGANLLLTIQSKTKTDYGLWLFSGFVNVQENKGLVLGMYLQDALGQFHDVRTLEF